MKKLFALAIAIVASLSVQAQNVQLHYDFGPLNTTQTNNNRGDVQTRQMG